MPLLIRLVAVKIVNVLPLASVKPFTSDGFTNPDSVAVPPTLNCAELIGSRAAESQRQRARVDQIAAERSRTSCAEDRRRPVDDLPTRAGNDAVIHVDDARLDIQRLSAQIEHVVDREFIARAGGHVYIRVAAE